MLATDKTTQNDPTSEHEIFGPYEVYDRLGVGGMATVHRAKERGIEGFERIVALKRLLPHLAEDASFVRSFVREAKLASQLQHANIVQLYDLGRVGPIYFIAMEHIEGRDVRKILRQARKVTGPPPLSVFIALMVQLCDALDYAHLRTDQSGQPLGIVHRDVSPSNLLVTDSGHLKVIDFGIAKAQTQQFRTQTGRVKGKLAYMPPEALKGRELDARSDIFSVGVIAYELLTARPLFASKNEYQTLLRVQQLEIEPPSRHNRKCPPELDDMVLKALDRDPSSRWQSAAEFRDALHFLRSQYQVSATNREVTSWLEWAFALEAPQTGSFTAISSASVSPVRRSGSYPAIAPARAFARAPSSITPAGGVTPPHRVTDPGSGAAPLPPPPGGPLAFDRSPDVTGGGIPEGQIDDVEEEAIDYAWGGQDEESNEPVILDDVPDVSDRYVSGSGSVSISLSGNVTGSALLGAGEPSSGGVKTTEFRMPPDEASLDVTNRLKLDVDATGTRNLGSNEVGEFGAGLVVTERKNRRVKVAVASVAIAAVAAAGLAMILTRVQTAAPASAALAPRTAAIKLVVDPPDATIQVLGYGRHTGSPVMLEVDAPATYRVEITRPGYKSHVTEVVVEGGDKVGLDLALRPGGGGKSEIKLESTPSEQTVSLDGERLPQTTPITVEVSAGTHVLVIENGDGTEAWRHEFEARENTHYEFHAPLERSSQRKRSRDHDESEETRESEPASKDDQGERTGRAEPTQSAPVEVVSDLASPRASTSRGIAGVVGADSPSALDSLDSAKPPPVPVKQRRGPVTIPPTVAKKRSGSLPKLAYDEDMPSRASAKLCIDTQGKVTSAEVLTHMPLRLRSRLERALDTWRYAPHLEGGEPIAACFAVNFRIDHDR